MSFILLKKTFRQNLMLLVIFLGVMLMYSIVMLSMYNPESIAALSAIFEVFPPDVMKAMGFSGAFSDLNGYLASWLYGLILTAFPMVFCIILGNRLVAKTVDSGSIACLLASPLSRTKIILTKAVFALGCVVLLQAVVFGAILLIAKIMLPDEAMDAAVFLRMNVTVMLVNLTAMGITFFFSSLFNDPKYATGFGSGVPIMFLLFNMLGNASSDAGVLKKISIYGWYDPVGIANGDETLTVNLVYIALVLILITGSVLVFRRKRLPI